MTAHSQLRGHPIEHRGGRWVYADTGEPTATSPRRPCGHCGLPDTPEGHDGCLGTLSGVMNACCGHGAAAEAYVQRRDGTCIRGIAALGLVTALRPAAPHGSSPILTDPHGGE